MTISRTARAARSFVEITGCFLILNFVDNWDGSELYPQSLEERLQVCDNQELSQLAEWKKAHLTLRDRFAEAVNQRIGSPRPVAYEDIMEFFDNLDVLADDDEEDSEDLDYVDITRFKEPFTTISLKEKQQWTAFPPPSPQEGLLCQLLSVKAQQFHNKVHLDNHRQTNAILLTAARETAFYSRLLPKEAVELEKLKAYLKVFLPWLFLTSAKHIAFRSWKHEAVIAAAAMPLRFNPLRGIVSLGVVGWMSYQLLERTLKERKQSSHHEVSIEVPPEKVLARLEESSFPPPYGASRMTPVTKESMAIYSFWRPFSETLLFAGFLVKSLRTYCSPLAAHSLAAMAWIAYRQLSFEPRSLSEASGLQTSSFLPTLSSPIFKEILLAMSGSTFFPLVFTYFDGLLDTALSVRECDHLLREKWEALNLVQIVARVVASTFGHFNLCKGPAKIQASSADYLDAAGQPTKEAQQLADLIIAIYSSDHFAEKGSQQMTLTDATAALTALESYMTEQLKVSNKPFGTFERLLQLLLVSPYSSPERQTVSKYEVEKLFSSIKTSLLKDLATFRGLERSLRTRKDVNKQSVMLDRETFSLVVANSLVAYDVPLAALDLPALEKQLRRWEEDQISQEDFLDVIQAFYEAILQADEANYALYDAALYENWEAQMAGRIFPTVTEIKLHRTQMREMLTVVRDLHTSDTLAKYGLTDQRFRDLCRKYDVDSTETNRLINEWQAYFSNPTYLHKILSKAQEKGRARDFISHLQIINASSGGERGKARGGGGQGK
eukprot:gene5738-6322_t